MPTSTVPAGPTVTVYILEYLILTGLCVPVQESESATKNCYALLDGTIRSGRRLIDNRWPVRMLIASVAGDARSFMVTSYLMLLNLNTAAYVPRYAAFSTAY